MSIWKDESMSRLNCLVCTFWVMKAYLVVVDARERTT
jgi:hypothetical protein